MQREDEEKGNKVSVSYICGKHINCFDCTETQVFCECFCEKKSISDKETFYFVCLQVKSKGSTTRHRQVGKRFALATARGIMSGVLLTPGPVATHKALKNLSMAFNVAVTKAKFVSACNRLQAANLGVLVTIENVSRQAQVFVKRPPEEVREIFADPEHGDLSSFEEYAGRFELPPSAAVTPPMKQNLVMMGMVRPEHFKEKS